MYFIIIIMHNDNIVFILNCNEFEWNRNLSQKWLYSLFAGSLWWHGRETGWCAFRRVRGKTEVGLTGLRMINYTWYKYHFVVIFPISTKWCLKKLTMHYSFLLSSLAGALLWGPNLQTSFQKSGLKHNFASQWGRSVGDTE